MICLHHLDQSRSQRVLWLLEELGCEYEIRHYQRDKKTHLAPPELYAVHPLGKSPVITDGDQVIAESAVIVEYLLDRYGEGRFRPEPGSPEYERYRYWLHYAEGSLMPLLVMSLIFSRIETAPMPFFVKPIAKGIAGKVKAAYFGPNLEQNLAYLQAHLEQHQWFCGDEFTAADVMMSFPLEAASTRSDGFAKCPRLVQILAAMRERPAYQKAAELA